MAEHGILMQDEMVRALLRPVGDPLRKDVTRRTSDVWAKRKVGDLLWVRECWAPAPADHPRVRVAYRSDGRSYGLNGGWASGEDGGLLFPAVLGVDLPPPKRWRPGIHMPRWASRLTLRVVSLRREPGSWPWPVMSRLLPEVDDAEARREGVEDRAAYLALFERINKGAYPEWVWRIEFEEVPRG